MIISPHLIVGATIGAKTHNLGLIIILGLLSHFIMDKIPHWDYPVLKNARLFKETKKIKYLFIFFSQIAIDWTIGLLIMFFCLFYKNLLNINSLIFVSLGIFISTLPDIILGICFLSEEKAFSKKFIKFHGFFHFKEESEKEGKITFLGLLTQIVVIIGALIGFFV
jgi:hypothetical protein